MSISLVGLLPCCADTAPSRDGGDGARPVIDAPDSATGSDAGARFDAEASMGDAWSTADSGSDAGATCEYPIVWRADPEDRAAAEAALASFAPGATPTWDARRGTYASVFNLSRPLACPAGGDAWSPILELVTARPEIFQIDLAEWEQPSPYPCSAVGQSVAFVRLNRARIGAEPVARDFVSFVLVRVGDEVRLTGFVGTYLPEVPAQVAAAMAACDGLTLAEARASALAETYPFATFEQCVPSGAGVYIPGANDTVELDPGPRWLWDESAQVDGVELTKEHYGRLVIHPDNVTPQLQTSDLNCPNPTGPGRIYGVQITFDAIRGAIRSKLPGLGCVVC